MKSKIVLLLLALWAGTSIGFAQGTAFSYQGRLSDNGALANGLFDLRFTLQEALAGGNQIGSAVTVSAAGVSNGLFNVALDFGAVT